MEIKFNCIGAERKKLAQAISEIIGTPAEYQYMPTCAYTIGDFYTVTKNGNLEIDDMADSKEVDNLIEQLVSRGYDVPQDDEGNGITVQISTKLIDERTINRLKRIIENKGELFKKAFKTKSLEIIKTDEKVEFPWFIAEQDGDADAYCTFISLLCDFAKNQRRINNKPDTSDNPKYAFRCFLLRLGFIGAEYKSTRKVLLRNLSGSSAFRNGGADNVSE